MNNVLFNLDAKKIHQDTYQVFYGHISLDDTEDVNSSPIWEVNEKTEILFCPKGVSIDTASNEDIEVIIYQSQSKPKESYFVSGEIEVGNLGLTLGNEAIGDKEAQIACSFGEKTISVCTDVSPEETLIIIFVISEVEKD